MSERELLLSMVIKKCNNTSTEIQKIENMGVKELRDYLRKFNAARKQGELNEQLRDWVFAQEKYFLGKISEVFNVGKHKLQLVYYGMMFNILEYAGCYLLGKSSQPIGITRSKYCLLLNLTDRLNSNNVRKAIADSFYGHDYCLAIARRENGEKFRLEQKLEHLEPIYKEIQAKIEKFF